MKKVLGLGMSACLSLALLGAYLGTGAVNAQAAGAASMAAQGRWDNEPSGMSEIEKRGFHDGVEGAHKDYGNHRSFDVHNREEFRHPRGAGHEKDLYRNAFERGYAVAVDHINHEHRW